MRHYFGPVYVLQTNRDVSNTKMHFSESRRCDGSRFEMCREFRLRFQEFVVETICIVNDIELLNLYCSGSVLSEV